MLIALGFNANAAMYIIGDAPFGGWNPPVGVEMTLSEDGVTYTYNATLTNADVWFIFAEAAGNWDDVNANRYDSGMSTDMTVTADVEFTPVKGNTNKSFKFSGTVGETYTITFNPTTMKAKVSGYVAPITEYTYTVAGSEASILGTAWDTSNTDNDMTLDETDGLYKLVKNGVEISGGTTLYYKVAQNHSWGTNWGKTPNGDNQDYTFNESGTYNLTFLFDLENEIVSLDAQKVQDGPVVDPITGDFYILGQVNGNGWNPSTGIEMATTDEDVYTLTDATFTDSGDGYAYFSFTSKLGADENDWSFADYRRGAVEDGTLVEDGVNAELADWGTSNAFKVLPGTYDVEVGLSSDYVKLTLKETPQPVVDDVYIFGDLNDYAWDPTQGVQMTYNEGIYTAEVNATAREDQEKAYIGFTKMLADAESETPWDDIAAYRFGPVSEGAFVMTEELLGVECSLATDGSYESIALPEGTWTVTVDLVNNKFTVNGTWPTDTVVPEPITVYTVVGPEYIFGSNWNEADENNDMTLVDGVYTWSKENVELTAGSFGFKVVGNHSWDNEWPMGYDNNWIKYVDESGIYTINITYDPEAADSLKITCEITKTGEIEPVHYDGDVYILGEVNDNGGWFTNVGVLMTRDAENNVYTATITTAGENVPEGEETGYSYFSFTKQLVDSAADWEGIAPYRFGAVSDDDFWVTDEVLGTEIALVNNGQSFRVPAGEWKLTLSVDNMTLVIEHASLRGDANNDTYVNVSDAIAMINAILNNTWDNINMTNADVNYDGSVNVSDAIALVNFILNNKWYDE